MSSEFWIGLALIPGLAAAALLLWLLYSLATWAWQNLHAAFLYRVAMEKNPVRVFEDDDRPEYLVQANKFRDAILTSPRLHVFTGLGWQVLFVRDWRTVPKIEPQ